MITEPKTKNFYYKKKKIDNWNWPRGQNPMQCCPKGSRQHCMRKNLVQCCLNTLWTTLYSWKPYAMLPERLQITLYIKKKILCNVVLILLGQHCTGKNPMQCCPRDSRQLCIRKNLVQCCLNTLWATLHSWKPYAMLPERPQTTLYKKNSVQCCLNTLGTTLHKKKSCAILC